MEESNVSKDTDFFFYLILVLFLKSLTKESLYRNSNENSNGEVQPVLFHYDKDKLDGRCLGKCEGKLFISTIFFDKFCLLVMKTWVLIYKATHFLLPDAGT